MCTNLNKNLSCTVWASMAKEIKSGAPPDKVNQITRQHRWEKTAQQWAHSNSHETKETGNCSPQIITDICVLCLDPVWFHVNILRIHCVSLHFCLSMPRFNLSICCCFLISCPTLNVLCYLCFVCSSFLVFWD